MEYPSFLEQSKNLAKFSLRFVKYLMENGPDAIAVSEEIYKNRISTCRSCPKFDPDQFRCAECGCFLNTKAKVPFEECPLKKWDSMSESEWETIFEEQLLDNIKEQ